MSNGSDYGSIPYEVDEIISWLQNYLDNNLPNMLSSAGLDSFLSFYSPSNTQLIIHTTEHTNSTGSDIVACTFEIKQKIHSDSGFKFNVEMKNTSGGSGCNAGFYKNDILIGSRQTVNETTYTFKPQNINVADWDEGDIIKLKFHRTVSGTAYVRNISISGDPIFFKEA